MNRIEWSDVHGLSKKNLRRYFILMPFIIVIVTLIANIVTPVFSAWEGKLLPVIEDFTVNVKDDGGTGSLLSGTFSKTRRCDLDRIEWHYVNGYLQTPLQVHFGSVTLRDKGDHAYEDLSLNVPPEIVQNHTIAHVFHHCHPFWETKTYIYP